MIKRGPRGGYQRHPGNGDRPGKWQRESDPADGLERDQGEVENGARPPTPPQQPARPAIEYCHAEKGSQQGDEGSILDP
jgi:hypothetical protein